MEVGGIFPKGSLILSTFIPPFGPSDLGFGVFVLGLGVLGVGLRCGAC